MDQDPTLPLFFEDEDYVVAFLEARGFEDAGDGDWRNAETRAVACVSATDTGWEVHVHLEGEDGPLAAMTAVWEANVAHCAASKALPWAILRDAIREGERLDKAVLRAELRCTPFNLAVARKMAEGSR